MTDAFRVLGQVAPAALTLTALYTAPASTQAVVSSLTVCNRDAGVGQFRVAVAVAGAADNAKQYLVYDALVFGNDTVAFTIGVTLAATDVVRVYANTALQSFSLFGMEVT